MCGAEARRYMALFMTALQAQLSKKIGEKNCDGVNKVTSDLYPPLQITPKKMKGILKPTEQPHTCYSRSMPHIKDPAIKLA